MPTIISSSSGLVVHGGRGGEAHRPEPPGSGVQVPRQPRPGSRCPGPPSPPGRRHRLRRRARRSPRSGPRQAGRPGPPSGVKVAVHLLGTAGIRRGVVRGVGRGRGGAARRSGCARLCLCLGLRLLRRLGLRSLGLLLLRARPGSRLRLVGLVGRGLPGRVRTCRPRPRARLLRGLLRGGLRRRLGRLRLRRRGRLAADGRSAGLVAVAAVLPGEREEAAVGNTGRRRRPTTSRSTCPTSRWTSTGPSRRWSETRCRTGRWLGAFFTRQTNPGSRMAYFSGNPAAGKTLSADLFAPRVSQPFCTPPPRPC